MATDQLITKSQPTTHPTNSFLLAQVIELEQQASRLARQGFDVTQASRELDLLRREYQVEHTTAVHDVTTNITDGNSTHSTSVDMQVNKSVDMQVNVVLNRVRMMLAKVEDRERFLHSPWPALMFVYEFAVLTGWGLLIFFFHGYVYRNYVEQRTWPLLLSLPTAFAVGSIASSSYALTSLYRHIAARTLDGGLSAWYIIKPVIGGISGCFVGIMGSVVLNVVGASGGSAHAVFLGIAYLAGANPEFTENLTNLFRQRMLGSSSSEQPLAERINQQSEKHRG